MDVFCPSCLKSVTLEARAPGEYSFECPECAAEASVTIPKSPGARPIVRPVRRAAARDSSAPPAIDFEPGSLGRTGPKKPAPSERRAKASPRGARPPAAVDFSFDGTDENRVDAEPPPPPVVDAAMTDYWNSPDFVPQPLRRAKTRKPATTPSSGTTKRGTRPRTNLRRAALAAGVWVGLIGIGIFLPEAAWVAIVIGVVMLMTSRRIVLRAARGEGAMVWLGCALVPFYNVLFALSKLRKLGPALLLAFCGYAYVIAGFTLVEVHKFLDAAHRPAGADEEDEAAGIVAAVQNALDDRFTLVVDGKEIPLEINELTYFPETAETANAEESFEFFGPDLSLHGTFPRGFRDRWMQLIGKTVPIIAHSKVPEAGDSQIELPKDGTVKVLEGSFTLTDVVRPAQPRLAGTVTLKVARSKQPETLQGDFLIRVKEAR
jgi:hypothetical protein